MATTRAPKAAVNPMVGDKEKAEAAAAAPAPQAETVTVAKVDHVTVTLRMDKETENTIRYPEAKRPGKPVIVGTLYVPKTTLLQMGTPDAITVTVGLVTTK